VYHKENSSETSGTPGYMSPEVMCGQNHSFAVDFFAVGVIGYEFMIGKRPYLGKSRKEIKEQIMSKQVQIRKSDLPSTWTVEAADCINKVLNKIKKMLQRKPINRLGFRGVSEIKEHAWFRDFNWDDLYNKRIEATFKPKIGDNFDKRYCEAIEKIGLETRERYESYLKDPNYQILFQNFTYINLKDPINQPSSLVKKDRSRMIDREKEEKKEKRAGNMSCDKTRSDRIKEREENERESNLSMNSFKKSINSTYGKSPIRAGIPSSSSATSLTIKKDSLTANLYKQDYQYKKLFTNKISNVENKWKDLKQYSYNTNSNLFKNIKYSSMSSIGSTGISNNLPSIVPKLSQKSFK
jgi:hypothetical protein